MMQRRLLSKEVIMPQHDQSVALHQYLTSIIGNTPFGVLTLSDDYEVSIINTFATKMLNFPEATPAELIDQPYTVAFQHAPSILEEFDNKIISYLKRSFEIATLEVGKHTIKVNCKRMLQGILITLEDITQQVEMESRLVYQANHDVLTNLINRREFEVRLKRFVDKAYLSNREGALFFMDLDRFKPVNDTAGHAAGDKLLTQIAGILTHHVRDRDTVARVGGDEFGIILENCPMDKAIDIANEIRQHIEGYTFVYQEKMFNIGISIGVAPIDGKQTDIESIINAADHACQSAKNLGRNQVQVSDADQSELNKHLQALQTLPQITRAINEDLFVLFAQEIVAVNTEDKHYEILLRMKNDKDDILAPNHFLPVAERYDMMPKIDRWVIEHTFKTIPSNFYCSINLSGQSLSDGSLIGFIDELLLKYDIQATNICFEITETSIIHNISKCRSLLHKLKQRGFSISLDDFGSGLSSYAYLKDLPLDYLKIDGIFVKGVANDIVDKTIVSSFDHISKVLGIKTVAEFVEDKAAYDVLQDIGVDFVQGYYLHKPQALSDILEVPQ